MHPARRIEDRIRGLCARIRTAQEHELSQVLSELQAAIHEYARRTENRISAAILSWHAVPHERRKV